MSKILAIDFDGVLHDFKAPLPGKRMGGPVDGAKSHMELLRAQGHTLIIHTVKAVTEDGKRAVRDWLNYYQIPFDDVTAIKPNASIFLDDHAQHFTSWDKVVV